MGVLRLRSGGRWLSGAESLFICISFQILTYVMESEKQTTERETVPQHLTSYKLIIDPALTKGLYKVYRFDGIRFNIPVSTF